MGHQPHVVEWPSGALKLKFKSLLPLILLLFLDSAQCCKSNIVYWCIYTLDVNCQVILTHWQMPSSTGVFFVLLERGLTCPYAIGLKKHHEQSPSKKRGPQWTNPISSSQETILCEALFPKESTGLLQAMSMAKVQFLGWWFQFIFDLPQTWSNRIKAIKHLAHRLAHWYDTFAYLLGR